MKKKIILTVAFIISLLPMLLNQYGGMKGVQEITGEISFEHSIRFAFPEFYVGLIISCLMIAVYFMIDRKVNGDMVVS